MVIIMDEWLELKANLIKAAEESSDLEAIEGIRISAVGKKGFIVLPLLTTAKAIDLFRFGLK